MDVGVHVRSDQEQGSGDEPSEVGQDSLVLVLCGRLEGYSLVVLFDCKRSVNGLMKGTCSVVKQGMRAFSRGGPVFRL